MTDTQDTTPAPQIRKGGCHCGAYRFELEGPEIKTVVQCNCNICSRKGYLFHFAGEGDKYTITNGSDDALTTYSFGAGNIHHKFCPTCGTAIYVTMPNGPPKMSRGINVHAIDDIDSWSLERKPFDGTQIGIPYETPAHKGALPETQEGEKIYTGSCHCGALTMAVASKPLDETYTGKVTECNCSICERNANIWIYPLKGQVVLAGDDANRGEYSFNYRVGNKTFCRICGVSMTNDTRKFSDEELSKVPEHYRAFIGGAHTIHPVNARTLHGVDLSKLKTEKSQGRNF